MQTWIVETHIQRIIWIGRYGLLTTEECSPETDSLFNGLLMLSTGRRQATER